MFVFFKKVRFDVHKNANVAMHIKSPQRYSSFIVCLFNTIAFFFFFFLQFEDGEIVFDDVSETSGLCFCFQKYLFSILNTQQVLQITAILFVNIFYIKYLFDV